jgi:hypothetical protein
MTTRYCLVSDDFGRYPLPPVPCRLCSHPAGHTCFWTENGRDWEVICLQCFDDRWAAGHRDMVFEPEAAWGR